MSLIVVIGLVLGISGTAYATIMALRGAWEGRVSDLVRIAEGLCSVLKESKDADILGPHEKHSSRFDNSHWRWEKSQWVPTVLMGLSSILMTVDVAFLDWSKDEKLFFGSRPEYWCNLYKAGLFVIIFADIVAVAVMWQAYHKINDAFADLKSLSRLHDKQKFLESISTSTQGLIPAVTSQTAIIGPPIVPQTAPDFVPATPPIAPANLDPATP